MSQAGDVPDSLEFAVKAAYLLKFPAFVEWQVPPPSPQFNLCVVGANPFNGLLRQAAQGQLAERLPVQVQTVASAGSASDCQMMYVAGSASQSVSAALAAVRGSPVLTVTDGQTDPAAKGIINFVVADGRVRFEVNLAEAATNHITISSKLLNIALGVRRSSGR